jgi:hypothetical protein
MTSPTLSTLYSLRIFNFNSPFLDILSIHPPPPFPLTSSFGYWQWTLYNHAYNILYNPSLLSVSQNSNKVYMYKKKFHLIISITFIIQCQNFQRFKTLGFFHSFLHFKQKIWLFLDLCPFHVNSTTFTCFLGKKSISHFVNFVDVNKKVEQMFLECHLRLNIKIDILLWFA